MTEGDGDDDGTGGRGGPPLQTTMTTASRGPADRENGSEGRKSTGGTFEEPRWREKPRTDVDGETAGAAQVRALQDGRIGKGNASEELPLGGDRRRRGQKMSRKGTKWPEM